MQAFVRARARFAGVKVLQHLSQCLENQVERSVLSVWLGQADMVSRGVATSEAFQARNARMEAADSRVTHEVVQW